MSILDGLYEQVRRARARDYAIKRVRVTPFVTAGAVAPRGREVWLHPRDLMEIACDPMIRTMGAGVGRPEQIMGIPVVHGIERA